MRSVLASRLPLLLLLTCWAALAPAVLCGDARAEDTAQETTIASIKCDVPAGQITQAVYNCVRNKIDVMSSQMVTTVFDKTSKIVVSLLMLAIIFFAIKFVLYGTKQPQQEFYIMMIKFVAIASLVMGIRQGGGILELRDTILHAGSGFQNLVFEGGGTFGVQGNNIFERMDNMFFKLVGVEDPTQLKMNKDMAGFAMMGGLMVAGPIGAKSLMEGSWAIGMLVGAFVMALFISIVSLIALTFLLMLSPIILPLALFPPTERMFQKWRGQIISYSLQPMIMTVFLSMMLIILGNLVGSLDNLITLSKDMNNNPNVNALRTVVTSPVAYSKKDAPTARPLTLDTAEFADPTEAGPAAKGIPSEVTVDALTMGKSSADVGVYITPFNQANLTALASQIVVLLITCGAMYRFMKELPGWASELAGGDRTVPNLAKSQPISAVNEQFAGEKK